MPAKNISIGQRVFTIGAIITALGTVAYFGFWLNYMVHLHSRKPPSIWVELPMMVTCATVPLGAMTTIIGFVLWPSRREGNLNQ